VRNDNNYVSGGVNLLKIMHIKKNLQPTIASTLTQQIFAHVGRFLIKTEVKVSAWVKQLVLKVLSDKWAESNYLMLVQKNEYFVLAIKNPVAD
jgi:hypothetical protein